MNDCAHETRKLAYLVYKCEECGMAITVPIANPALADAITNIRQGKVPADYALTAGSWTEDERATLAAVTVCQHTERTAFICTNGEPRERCNSCRRVWNQPKDFILNHKPEAINGS